MITVITVISLKEIITSSYDEFDLTSISLDFMKSCKVVHDVHSSILKLEQSFKCKSDIDITYAHICDIIKQEMYNHIKQLI